VQALNFIIGFQCERFSIMKALVINSEYWEFWLLCFIVCKGPQNEQL